MWQGRRLALFSNVNGEQYAYTYNADGIRISKQIRNADNALITGVEYIYNGSKLVAESRNGEWMYYVYDETGTIAGLSYNGVLYLFRKNLQGDVTGIYNANGALIAEYSYTPYGAMLAITDANGNDISGNSTHIANINPIRYRGYYYDTETGFYYLQTRYYDPIVGRFLNADAFVSTGQGIIGNNMFAYCLNRPIIGHDMLGLCFNCDYNLAGPCTFLYSIDYYYSYLKQKYNVEPLKMDFSFDLYNNDRFEDKTSFNETFFSVSASGPDIALKDNKIEIFSVEGDFSTGGWEWEKGELKPFNFGHVEAGVVCNEGKVQAGAMASVWSPDASVKIGKHEVSFGLEVISAGIGGYAGSSGLGFSIGFGVFGISFSWDW